MDRTEILISVQRRYFDSIACGEKTVELRRRAPRVPAGSRIWLYCKSPVATVAAVCKLQRIESLPIDEIWERHGNALAISKPEFEDYLLGREVATALVIQDVQLLRKPLHLEAMRLLKINFQPPQFFMHLRDDCALTNRLMLELA